MVVALLSSVTVSVTGQVPAVANAWFGATPVAVAPSLKLHAYDAIVPSGSLEPAASKLHWSWTHDDVKDAAGGWFGTGIDTLWLVALARLASSVTWSTTVNTSAVDHVCDAVTPVAAAPSPKSQLYEAMLPSVSLEADASKVHAFLLHCEVKLATGGVLITTASKLSNDHVIGVFDAPAPRLTRAPTKPVVCSSGCVSEAVTCHVDGSAVPAT